jgi:sortase A
VAQHLFLWLGVITLVYVGAAFAYASGYQRYESWKFDRELASPVSMAAMANLAAVPEDAVELGPGTRIGRLEIPRLGISVMVLHGIAEEMLALGAGHVPGTPLPGGGGNFVLAAHRDTFFRSLESILPGDSIRVVTLQRTYLYTVASTQVVDPDATYVMESRARPELTLITCYPFYLIGTAPKRFIVHAEAAR